jgi:hypothetical protein
MASDFVPTVARPIGSDHLSEQGVPNCTRWRLHGHVGLVLLLVSAWASMCYVEDPTGMTFGPDRGRSTYQTGAQWKLPSGRSCGSTCIEASVGVCNGSEDAGRVSIRNLCSVACRKQQGRVRGHHRQTCEAFALHI